MTLLFWTELRHGMFWDQSLVLRMWLKKLQQVISFECFRARPSMYVKRSNNSDVKLHRTARAGCLFDMRSFLNYIWIWILTGKSMNNLLKRHASCFCQRRQIRHWSTQCAKIVDDEKLSFILSFPFIFAGSKPSSKSTHSSSMFRYGYGQPPPTLASNNTASTHVSFES